MSRVHYRTADGWRAPLFRLDPAPGGSGEPVLLLHGLALGAHSLRYGAGPTLASALARAGYTVYCVSHRGDRDAQGPTGGAINLDAVVERDLPAAIKAALTDCGYRRPHIVGHGLGGQLALALASRENLASTTVIAAPVRFTRPRSETLRLHRALAQLPSHWHLPTATLARLAAPWLDEQATMRDRLHPGSTEPSRVRGAVHHTSDDLALGILQQLRDWIDSDSLMHASGLDYVEALVEAHGPLHLVHAPGDSLGHPGSPEVVLDRWAGPSSRTDLPGHLARLDALLGKDADTEVFAPVVTWLDSVRRRAW
ncbi:MAG: alpha/beta fold hydrolase [Proteobacteria bacterium]|nr:alpha/beta fold hydrolase [Pseudomonadota bacterium]